MKQVFYHFKGEADVTHIYKTDDSLKQIKGDIRGNGAVLDAVYNEETEKVVVYTKKYSAGDYRGNLL